MVCLTATLEVEFQLRLMKLYEVHYNMYYNCYCIHSVVVNYSARRKTRILKQRSLLIMRCSFKFILCTYLLHDLAMRNKKSYYSRFWIQIKVKKKVIIKSIKDKTLCDNCDFVDRLVGFQFSCPEVFVVYYFAPLIVFTKH